MNRFTMKRIESLICIILLALSGISCSKEEKTLAFTQNVTQIKTGETIQLEMTVDGKPYDLSKNPLNVSFSCTANGIVEISSKGVAKAIKVGTTYVQAEAKGCTKTKTIVKVLSSAEAAPELTIGSFNLWIHGTGTDQWAWNLRKPHLAQAFIDNEFDILGIQEADATIRNELPGLVKAAGREYEWWFVCRDNQSATSGEAVGIVYDASKFSMGDKGYFWLSPTPDVVSYGWDETGYHRVCAYAKMTVKETGVKFLFMATHGPLGDEASAHCAQIFIDKAKEINKENMTCILVGDMNSHPNEPLAIGLRTYWNDPVMTLDADHRIGPRGTFNSHDINRKMDSDNYRIDYILYAGPANKIYVKSYRCNDKKYHTTADIYPSDHLPISLKVKLL